MTGLEEFIQAAGISWQPLHRRRNVDDPGDAAGPRHGHARGGRQVEVMDFEVMAAPHPRGRPAVITAGNAG